MRKPHKGTDSSKGPRRNEAIRVPEVRVIDAKGLQLGVMRTLDARALARSASMDLVEINPKTYPPVCKILDYGKHLYDKKKAEAVSKRSRVVSTLKEIKLRPKTDEHDLEVKTRNARRFLEKGDKVKITCRFRGRERSHPEIAERQLARIAEAVADIAGFEVRPMFEGRAMVTILSRASKGK